VMNSCARCFLLLLHPYVRTYLPFPSLVYIPAEPLLVVVFFFFLKPPPPSFPHPELGLDLFSFKMKFLYMITLVAGATAIAIEPRHHQGKGKGGKNGGAKGKLGTGGRP
jgi:hypothetical protein